MVGSGTEAARPTGRGGTVASKREWLRVWQQLRQQQRTVEKLSPLKILEQEMGSNEEVVALQRAAQEQSTMRSDEGASLRGDLRGLAKQWLLVHRHLRAVQGGAAGDAFLGRLRELMERLEASLTSFKQQQRAAYAAMEQEEQALSRDIDRAESEVLEWIEAPASGGKGTPARSPRRRATTPGRGRAAKAGNGGPSDDGRAPDPATGLPGELENIDHQMARLGGEEGSWATQPHATFVRLFTRLALPREEPLAATHHRVRALFRAARETLPTTPTEEVEAHYAHYARWLRLVARQREALRRAREEREQKAAEAAAAQERERREREAAEAEARQAHRQAEEEGRKRKKAEVQKWREAQRAREAAQREAAEAEAAKRRRAAQQQGQKAKVRTADQIERYRQQREQERQALERAGGVLAAATQRAASAHGRARGSQQHKLSGTELTRVTRRQEAEAERIRRDGERRKRAVAEAGRPRELPRPASAGRPVVKRDPSRLLQPTAARERSATTAEQLDERRRMRAASSAHDRFVPSAAGAAHARGRGYTFAGSGKAQAGWRAGL